ncbi:MAG: hypothetical protein ACYCSS_15195, partial [Sulfuriferula sp.]
MIQPESLAPSAIEGESPGDVSWLLPEKRHPYYIVAPRYVRTSAGIKVLHLLCHALNRLGERAYLITYPYYPPAYATNPELNTPLLTQRVLEYDFEAGLAPIVVYPETVPGNPFHASFVVRYVLNFPGLLGGDTTYGEDEFCVTYSEHLAKSVHNSRLTLFLPASDPRVFHPYPRVPRKGSCFYAGKYKYHHGGELYEITNNSVEITRDQPDSPTPGQIADLFRHSEVFYTYENTALAIEALLCECPVVFLPNPYLDHIIGIEEHGWDGIAWGHDDGEIARAKNTVHNASEHYLGLFAVFSKMLREFVAQT